MFIQVTTTASTKEEAVKIAETLLDKKLAACVQIIPAVESHYIWNGKKETAQEFMLLIKTAEQSYPAVEQAIKSIHSYETPEIIAVPLTHGSKEYLSWIDQSLN